MDRLTLVLLISLSLAISDCRRSDEGRPKVFPISGTVSVNGKSAPHAEVMFHLVGAAPKGNPGRPAAKPMRPFARMVPFAAAPF